jgi:hypothetical protein
VLHLPASCRLGIQGSGEHARTFQPVQQKRTTALVAGEGSPVRELRARSESVN